MADNVKGYIIEAWNQPDGRGYGWAPCTNYKAERFFVFSRGRSCTLDGRGFPTRAEARTAIAKAEGK